VHGSLDQFPYERPGQEGVFKIDAPFKAARFDPSPWPAKRTSFGKIENWPAFDNIDGRFLIDNKLLRFDISTAQYRGLKVDKVRGEIAALADRESPFIIEGTARGPLSDMLDYLDASPLPDVIDRATERIKATGDAHLALTLTLPRTPHPVTTVKGRVTLADNEMTYASAPTVTHINGAIDFTGHSALMANVTGQWLGGGVRADGGLNPDGSVAVDLAGRIAVERARTLSDTPGTHALLDYISGSAPYTLNVRGPRHAIPDIALNSDLTGLAIALPPPFNKTAGERMPLQASLRRYTTPDDERDAPDAPNMSARLKTRVSQVEFHAGPLNANYLVGGGAEPVALRGAIGLNKPATLPVEGIVAAIDLDSLDIDEWRVVIDKLAHPVATAVEAASAASAAAASSASASASALGTASAPATTVAAMAPMTPAPAASSKQTGAAPFAPASALTDASLDRAPPARATPTSPPLAPTNRAASAGAASAVNPVSLASQVPPSSSSPHRAGAVTGAFEGVRSGAPPDAGPAATAASSFMPTRIAAHISNLTLLKRHWENVVLGATHENETWQANLASDQISGHIAWRAPANGAHGELEAHLAKLEIPKATEHDVVGQFLERQSNEFPGIDLDVANLIVYGHSLGRLQIQARNTDINSEPVWQLDQLVLDNPAAKLTASGNWRTSRRARFMSPGEDFDNDDPKTPRRTVLDFNLDVLDAGALLTNLGLPRTIENGKGNIAGKIGWRSGPTTINYPTLNGQVSVDLHDGTLVKVNSNAARLIGLLSVQTLMRVLTLNFGDVVGEGLPFDSITATSTLHDGIAKTSDFELVTHPARATMAGNIDLVDRKQDLIVKVVPTINFGTAAIAVAFVNPLIGLGSFVGQYVLSESISNTFSRNYAVTGSWQKPTIRQIKSDEGKMDHPAVEHSAQ
jgi:uncharacterized protein YhdP